MDNNHPHLQNENTISLTRTRHIAGNTMVLFLRMLLLTIVNLYAVRLIIKGMGMEDYGIFNAVAGVVTATNVFCGVLALSIQRFFSYALGTNNTKQLNDIFSCSINIILVLSVLTIAFLESIGLWFVHNQLTIPAERMQAALWIFQFAIFTLVCSFLQTPYTAAMFAHEDMGTYTLISTVECVLKFLTAYLIGLVCYDHLQFYALGLLLCAVIVLLLYVFTTKWRYEECHYRICYNKELYKKILSFSGWTLFGSIAGTAMLQGNTIILNISFGTIATAAFGIALQINNAFNSLTSNMVLAFRPPMIKLFAEQQFDQLDNLFCISNKCILYILIVVSLPILFEMDTILLLWLGEATVQTVTYARLIVIYVTVIAMHNPITIIIHATGNIKHYHLFVESFTLMCLPVTWCLFQLGMPDYYVFFSMIGICMIAHIARLFCLRNAYEHFSIHAYLLRFLIPAFGICMICALFTYFLHHLFTATSLRMILVFILSPLLSMAVIYMVGINKSEKDVLQNMATSFFTKKLHRQHK